MLPPRKRFFDNDTTVAFVSDQHDLCLYPHAIKLCLDFPSDLLFTKSSMLWRIHFMVALFALTTQALTSTTDPFCAAPFIPATYGVLMNLKNVSGFVPLLSFVEIMDDFLSSIVTI